MIAKVQYQGKVYYSYVFACFQIFYRDHFVVYDSIDNKFDIISLFADNGYGHRQIGLIEESECDFIRENDRELDKGKVEHLKGYSWLLSDSKYLKNIEDGDKMPFELIEKAKKMNETINPNQWNEVKNDKDIKYMVNHVGDFHDCYLVEIKGIADHIDVNETAKLQIRFTSQGPFDVLVEFEDGIYMKSGFYSCNRIYMSTIVIGKEYIYWVNDAEDGLLESEVNSYQYIQAKKLRWKYIDKIENDW